MVLEMRLRNEINMALHREVSVSLKEGVPRLDRSFSQEIEIHRAQDENHSSHILKGLHSLYKEGRCCDVTFLINMERTRKLKAHRAVLISFSSYFEALLGSNWDDGKQDEVDLQGIDEAVFRALVEFAYTGRIEITTENVQDLLHGANYFGVEFVQKSCADFLKAAIDDKTCLGILQLADSYAIEYLRSAAKLYVLQHFATVSEEEEFLELPIVFILEILRDDKLGFVRDGILPLMAESEKFVLEAVFRYVRHDLGSRKSEVPELLANVRLPLLHDSPLEALKAHELVKDTREALEMVDKAIAVKKSNTVGGLDCSWLQPREWGCRIWKGRIYANGYVRPDIESFDDNTIVPSESEIFVKGMKLWIRRWDGRPILGGVRVFYSNGSSVMHGGGSATEQHEFHIDEDERITKVDVQSGYMIDRFTFYTNIKQENGEPKKYGPYGGPGGSAHSEMPPGSFGYLAWIRGTVVRDKGTEGITKLQFVWRTFGYKDGEEPGVRPGASHKSSVDEYNLFEFSSGEGEDSDELSYESE